MVVVSSDDVGGAAAAAAAVAAAASSSKDKVAWPKSGEVGDPEDNPDDNEGERVACESAIPAWSFICSSKERTEEADAADEVGDMAEDAVAKEEWKAASEGEEASGEGIPIKAGAEGSRWPAEEALGTGTSACGGPLLLLLLLLLLLVLLVSSSSSPP